MAQVAEHPPLPIAAVIPPHQADFAVLPFNLESWNLWQARGRAADVALGKRMRTLAALAVAIGCLAASFYSLF